MTGQWEAYLKRIQRGEAQLEPFLRGIEDYVRDVVGKVGRAQAAPHQDNGESVTVSGYAAETAPAVTAAPDESLDALLHRAFGFESFRANQEEVCRTVIAGRDALLVMPTGAGKSLCYQLPGLARGGTTLVISPLIALMEDQFAKAAGTWLRGGVHPFRTRPRGLAPGLHRLSERQAAVPLHRARTPARARLSGDAGEAETVADRDRRSALHFAMGARFPPRLPAARRLSADAAPGAGDCAHRHGDGGGAARHLQAIGSRSAGQLHSRVSAVEHRD